MKRGNLSLSIAVAIVVIMTIMIRGSFAQTASNDIKALFSAQKTFSHVEALVNILEKVSDLVVHHPDISQLDFNPVIVYPQGAMIVDARIILEVP